MSQQSTNETESDDLAVHTVLDEVHDTYDEIANNDESAPSLAEARSRIGVDVFQVRHLGTASLDEQRRFGLELAARLVRYVELVDLEAAER